MEVWFEVGEIGVGGWDGGNIGKPLAPHAILVGGSLRSGSRAGLCICRAEVSEESIAGLRGTSCQGWACG